MRRHKRARTEILIAYVDFLAAVLAFVFLMVTTHKDVAANISVKAEYIVTAEWSNTLDMDVDLWAETPAGHLVFYKNRQEDLVSLDQDCMGFVNSSILLNGVSVTAAEFKEMDTIQGLFPGDYIFGVYMFSARLSGVAINNEKDSRDLNARVHFEILKLNPKTALVFSKDVVLHHLHQGFNLVKMTVNNDPSQPPTFSEGPLEKIMDLFYTEPQNKKAN
jgi:hypothetical protein